MPYCETRNGKIWFADHRDPTAHTPTLILIHGAGAMHLDWPAELRRLPEGNVIAPDLPGHGKSEGKGRQSVGAYASDMIAFMDALDIDKAIIAGHSMGGAIAQMMGLNYANRVQGLILVCTGAYLNVNPAILDGLQNTPEETAKMIIKWAWAKDAPEQMKRLSLKRLLETPAEVTLGDYKACSQFDLRKDLARIQAPTLVIGGEADKMTPITLSEELATNIPNAKLERVPHGGHMLMLEQPKAVADVVQNWLTATF